MEVLKLDKPTAIKLYPTAAPEFKTMLESSFGKEAFSGKVIDRLNSIEDCYSELGLIRPVFLDPVMEGFKDAITAVQAINEGWTPDYDNQSQYKYEIWWDMRNGSLEFFDGVGYWRAGSYVGSRLCFKSRELAKWAAKQKWFVNTCKKFMVNPK